MPFKVQVGPPQIAIHQAMTVLLTESNGQIIWPSDKGLFFFDTRLISHWTVFANGAEWDLLNGGAVNFDAARIFLTNRAFLTEDGPIPAETLAFQISRVLDKGLHEDLDITNHSKKPIRFNLEIVVRSDFADVFDVKSKRDIRRGHIDTDWSEHRQTLRTTYRNADFHRAVSVSVGRADSRAVYANGRLSFEVRVPPQGKWHACLLYELIDGDTRYHAPHGCGDDPNSPPARQHRDWRETVLKLRSSNEEFYRFFHQAIDDMAALRLPMEGTDHLVFIPAAGLPWFMAPFGRDSLIVSLQNILVYPEFARGALDVLGRWQCRERDPYRDAEPGKIMHELRYGELAHFRLIPHTPYYGTADATPLFLVTLHAAWRATGDLSLLETFLPVAEGCLEWIDNDGDRDGDGLQEYQTRSPVGYENMAWKDAGDSMTYADGTPVKGPKALCELQGYVYDAWLRMAEVFDALGKPDRAAELRQKAANLFRRFNDAFWDEETGYYAYMLDGEKQKVTTVASNPGHLLWSGIVPPDRAARVVKRLMAPDMNSGWGIRTLSANHPAFNPYSYQNGSVWPHDNSLIALGFKRYGFAEEVSDIARAISDAASHFLLSQLPELYAGVQRANGNFPVQYLGANVPQAWAAGSCFAFLQAMLGIQPDAPNDRLYVDPALPAWLPDVTLSDLRVGRHKLDIKFHRQNDKTVWDVVKGDARLVEFRRVADVLPKPPTA
ncbi:MAG TPA: glycogen debranching N-terminal domain-containing protein [Rhodopila sp.]|uniref:amylo-alpha-1,6-glucosidase n=1 Tax=Rhodopila sp. TaxID=2480087 RepID=UPI002C1EEC9E|nr:glycogen debranching N-terminal domain-containing protein [Rhodopila sp.]HVY17224.1 glycogen debranching N-terminal domain-containing protein [Rhodopila sp.]